MMFGSADGLVAFGLPQGQGYATGTAPMPKCVSADFRGFGASIPMLPPASRRSDLAAVFGGNDNAKGGAVLVSSP